MMQSGLSDGLNNHRGVGVKKMCRRSSVLLWIVGAVEVILFSCWAFTAGAVGLAPVSMLEEAISPQMTAEEFSQLISMRPTLAVMAAVLTILIVIPGLILIGLAFGVRRGRTWAITVARVILLVQSVLFGLFLLLGLINGLLTGDVIGFILILILFGGTLAGQVYTNLSLGRAAHEARYGGADDDDPWNQHLSNPWSF